MLQLRAPLGGRGRCGDHAKLDVRDDALGSTRNDTGKRTPFGPTDSSDAVGSAADLWPADARSTARNDTDARNDAFNDTDAFNNTAHEADHPGFAIPGSDAWSASARLPTDHTTDLTSQADAAVARAGCSAPERDAGIPAIDVAPAGPALRADDTDPGFTDDGPQACADGTAADDHTRGGP